MLTERLPMGWLTHCSNDCTSLAFSLSHHLSKDSILGACESGGTALLVTPVKLHYLSDETSIQSPHPRSLCKMTTTPRRRLVDPLYNHLPHLSKTMYSLLLLSPSDARSRHTARQPSSHKQQCQSHARTDSATITSCQPSRLGQSTSVALLAPLTAHCYYTSIRYSS